MISQTHNNLLPLQLDLFEFTRYVEVLLVIAEHNFIKSKSCNTRTKIKMAVQEGSNNKNMSLKRYFQVSAFSFVTWLKPGTKVALPKQLKKGSPERLPFRWTDWIGAVPD